MIWFVLGLIVGVCAAVLGLALGRAAARGDCDIDSVLSPENHQEPTQEPPGSSADAQQGTEATLPHGTVCPGIERDCEEDGGVTLEDTYLWLCYLARENGCLTPYPWFCREETADERS